MTSIGDRVRVVAGEIESTIEKQIAVWVGTPYKSARIIVGTDSDGEYFGLTCETVYKGNRVVVHPGNFGNQIKYAATRATPWQSPVIFNYIDLCDTSATYYVAPSSYPGGVVSWPYYNYEKTLGTNWCGFTCGRYQNTIPATYKRPTAYFERKGCPSDGFFEVAEMLLTAYWLGELSNGRIHYELICNDSPATYVNETCYANVWVDLDTAVLANSQVYVIVSSEKSGGTYTVAEWSDIIYPTQYKSEVTLAFPIHSHHFCLDFVPYNYVAGATAYIHFKVLDIWT